MFAESLVPTSMDPYPSISHTNTCLKSRQMHITKLVTFFAISIVLRLDKQQSTSSESDRFRSNQSTSDIASILPARELASLTKGNEPIEHAHLMFDELLAYVQAFERDLSLKGDMSESTVAFNQMYEGHYYPRPLKKYPPYRIEAPLEEAASMRFRNRIYEIKLQGISKRAVGVPGNALLTD